MDEPYPLPAEWRWEPLEALAEVRTGVAKGRALGNSDTVQVPYLRVANVQSGYLDLGEVKTIEIRRSEIDRYSLKPNDILFTEGGDRDKLGRGAVWKGEIERCVHQNHVFAARLRTRDVLPAWVSLASQAQYARDYFMAVARQTVNLASINATKLRSFPVPVPSIHEQRRLLAKHERLTSESRTARKALDRVPALLKRFRRAVLAAAFRGELTKPDWANHHGLGGAAISYTGPKPRSNAALTAGPRVLPEGWYWATVGQQAEVVGGIQKTPARLPVKNSYPYLRVANVLRGRLNLGEIHRFELVDGELEKWRLKSGDVLIVEGNGSISEIGRCALWGDEIADCVHQNHIIRVRFGPEIDSPFFHYYLNSDEGRASIGAVASSTSGLYTLSVSKIQRIQFPVAPLDEQRRIVVRLGSLIAQATTIEEAAEAARWHAEQVDQAILARAFRGEL